MKGFLVNSFNDLQQHYYKTPIEPPLTELWRKACPNFDFKLCGSNNEVFIDLNSKELSNIDLQTGEVSWKVSKADFDITKYFSSFTITDFDKFIIVSNDTEETNYKVDKVLGAISLIPNLKFEPGSVKGIYNELLLYRRFWINSNNWEKFVDYPRALRRVSFTLLENQLFVKNRRDNFLLT